LRKIYISLFICFLTLTITAKAYPEEKKFSGGPKPSINDIISYCGSSVDVSSEILKAYFGKDYKLLGKFSKGLGALDIIDKISNADDKGAVLAAANMASMEFISEISPVAGGLITFYTAYCKSLVIVRDYLFIPALKEDVYVAYKKHRFLKDVGEEVKPEDVFINLALKPLEASIKDELLKKKYDSKQITDWAGILIPKWGDKLDKEAHMVLMARLEARYNRDRAIEGALASQGSVEGSLEKFTGELKENLTMPIQGKVLDKETKEPVARATVKVKGYNIGKIANSSGFFRLEVPYKVVGSNSFKIAIKKEGYKPAISNKIYSFTKGIPKSLTCYLTPLKEEEDLTKEELKEQLKKCGEVYQDARSKAGKLQEGKAKKLEDEYHAANKTCQGMERGKCISANDRKYRKALHEDLYEETQVIFKKIGEISDKCYLEIRRKLTLLELKEYEKDMQERVKAWVEWRKTSGEEEMGHRKEREEYIKENYRQRCEGCSRDLKEQLEKKAKELEEDERKNRERFEQSQKEAEEYRESHLKNAENVYRQTVEAWNQRNPEYKIELKDLTYLRTMLAPQ